MKQTAHAAEDGLKLSSWLPYRLFLVAAQVARPLESFYSETFGLSQAGWRIALDPFATSRGIGQLKELGFAVRRAGKSDRRFAAVSITRSGRTAFNRIASLGSAIEARLLARLSQSERTTLDSALTRLEGESARIDAGGWRALLDDTGAP